MAEDRADKWFEKILKYATKRIQTFVAFLFLLLSVGILIGYLLALHIGPTFPIYLAVPPFLGLLAYYNRDLAIILFAGFLVFFLFLI